MISLITPDWPAPDNVKTIITTRSGGVSKAPFDSLNLAHHVGDDPEAVRKNRESLKTAAYLPDDPFWLDQIHGCDVVDLSTDSDNRSADASLSRTPGKVCVVMTADCLPVLMCDRSGTVVSAIHAGWRGLLNGVIEKTFEKLSVPAEETLVWLGPSIGPQAFEVGDEVYESFTHRDARAASAFKQNRPGHWLADIYALARLRLADCGAGFVGGGDYCTVSESERFFSYRRDGQTGRMASMIWLQPD